MAYFGVLFALTEFGSGRSRFNLSLVRAHTTPQRTRPRKRAKGNGLCV